MINIKEKNVSQPEKVKVPEYPKLMVHNNTSKLVLFTSRGTGIVLKVAIEGGSHGRVGSTWPYFVERDYTLYTGVLEISNTQ
ncbi:MAG: hypothetical protein KAS32_28965 [Candidatus Peribacteraceae bacterium]|nr:hypothetical protein [Candidatus Peribacteraceae bacterium]